MEPENVAKLRVMDLTTKKLVGECFQDCVVVMRRAPELQPGELVCMDRCADKFKAVAALNSKLQK
jgi:hypothetical protein